MALLFLAPPWVGATVEMPRPTFQVVRDAHFLGVVVITTANLLDAKPTPSEPSCGFSYKAEVVDSLKGPTGSLQFVSAEQLHVGDKYLLALAQGVASARNIVSTNSTMLPQLKQDAAARESCAKKHKGLRVIDGSVSAFSAFKWIRPKNSPVREDWVEYSALAYGGDLDVIRIDVDSFMIDRYGESPRIVTAPQLSQDYLVTEHSLNRFGQYIRWQDFRKYLIGQVARATHNNALERP